MKFLKSSKNNAVVPIKFMYNTAADVLMIVYKDILTNQKFVENIQKPKVPVWIIKPEYRNQTGLGSKFDSSYRHDWLNKDLCEEYLVPYKYRKYEIAKILEIEPEEVVDSPYVGWGDLDIKTIYFLEFIFEYGTDIVDYTPTEGFFDIETDVAKTKDYGYMPITCIIYVDGASKTAYQFAMNNEEYGNMKWVREHLKDMIDDYHEKFTPTYGEFEYHIAVFNNELDMIAAFWDVVRHCDPDFLEAWNAPFDVINLINRIQVLGVNPESVISDEDFMIQKIYVKEDTTNVVKRRKHTFDIPVKPIVCCQMRNYAGVRSGRAVIPSYSLEAISTSELGQHKVDYKTDEGSLTNLLYTNFAKYLLYNINDSMLQYGISDSTKDVPTIYGKMYQFALTEPEVFTSTTMLINELIIFGFKYEDKILANNRNRAPKDMQMLIQMGYGSDAATIEEAEEMDEAEEDSNYADVDMDALVDKITDNQNVLDENGNKKKFAGAIVMHPRRQHYTGYKINGRPAQHVHRNAVDMDIGSEYPTAARAMNLSNDTWVGKVIPENDEDFKFPMYSQYTFIGDDKATYRFNPVATLLETVAQGDYVIAGEIALGLPSFDEMRDKMIKDGIIK